MFSSITWSQYFSTMFILLCCYYTFVAIYFFKWNLLAIAGIKKVVQSKGPVEKSTVQKQISENPLDYLPKGDMTIDLSSSIHAFEDEVKAFLQESESVSDKERFLNALQKICLKYPALQHSDNIEALNLFVLNETEKYNFQNISAQDFQHLWHQ